jgi:hypothetical protein
MSIGLSDPKWRANDTHAAGFVDSFQPSSRSIDATRRAELNDWLTHKVRPMFEQRVLPITEDIMFKWRLLVEDGRKVGHTFSQPDLIVATTGLHHGFTVVTRDTDDFVKARAAVFNPWIDPLPVAAVRTSNTGTASPSGQCS